MTQPINIRRTSTVPYEAADRTRTPVVVEPMAPRPSPSSRPSRSSSRPRTTAYYTSTYTTPAPGYGLAASAMPRTVRRARADVSLHQTPASTRDRHDRDRHDRDRLDRLDRFDRDRHDRSYHTMHSSRAPADLDAGAATGLGRSSSLRHTRTPSLAVPASSRHRRNSTSASARPHYTHYTSYPAHYTSYPAHYTSYAPHYTSYAPQRFATTDDDDQRRLRRRLDSERLRTPPPAQSQAQTQASGQPSPAFGTSYDSAASSGSAGYTTSPLASSVSASTSASTGHSGHSGLSGLSESSPRKNLRFQDEQRADDEQRQRQRRRQNDRIRTRPKLPRDDTVRPPEPKGILKNAKNGSTRRASDDVFGADLADLSADMAGLHIHNAASTDDAERARLRGRFDPRTSGALPPVVNLASYATRPRRYSAGPAFDYEY